MNFVKLIKSRMKIFGIKIKYDHNNAYDNQYLLTSDIPSEKKFVGLLFNKNLVEFKNKEGEHDYEWIAEVGNNIKNILTIDIIDDKMIVIQHIITDKMHMIFISKN